MGTILIIGGGSIGKRHTRNLSALGEKDITIVEVNDERGRQIEKELGVPTVTSIEAASGAKKYDIAFVCSPSIYHLEQARTCVEYGCDVFVEKPLSHTMDGVGELVSLAAEKKLITMVGSNWKFYPLFHKMKELIDGGAIGRILSARCQFGSYLPDWHLWEDYRKGYSANKKLGGGILLDSHEFDYLTWFVGKKVKKLVCIADHVSDIEADVEDVAEAILQFEDGTIGEIHQDYIQRFSQRTFEFFGSEGTIAWDINQKKVLLKSKIHGEREYPLDGEYDFNDMYVAEMRHFLECVRNRKETITPFAAGAEVVRLICAAKESSASGRAVNF